MAPWGPEDYAEQQRLIEQQSAWFKQMTGECERRVGIFGSLYCQALPPWPGYNIAADWLGTWSFPS